MKLFSFLTAFVLTLFSFSFSFAADANTAIECGSTSTYYPLGYVWSPTPPIQDNPIAINFYQVAPSSTGTGNLSLSDAKAAVMRAFSTWESSTCDSDTVNLPDFEAAATDHPTLDQGDVWDDLELTSHKNVVFWDNTGNNPLLSDGTVAYTLVNYFDITAQAIDSDMMFNDAGYSWRVTSGSTTAGCTAGEENCFDIETVALHESGHFIGFGHVNCAESVMFPTGNGAAGGHELSDHEKAGICAIYPPRAATGIRTTGESCNEGECPGNHKCLVSQTGGNDYGRCVKLCTIDNECGDGHYCGSVPLQGGGSLNYCAPGLGSGSTVNMGDLCMPCSSGTHCQSGLCLEVDGNQFCSQPCNETTTYPTTCPGGFSCIQPEAGSGFCWPDNRADCGIDTRPILNHECYSQGTQPDGSDYFEPCGPGLICMGFRPLCSGLKGACVLYCDTGTPCLDELTCCYGIDETGHCMGPSEDFTVGGCFDIRAEGEACVTAEQSVCRAGFECVAYGEATAAKCYEQCPDDVCVGDEYCLTTAPICEGMVELKNCCSNDNQDNCIPGVVSALREVGVSCNVNADCFSGLCLKYDDEAACSRSCDSATGIGCPGEDEDMDGDGVADGGFDCLNIAGESRCWPKNGAIGVAPSTIKPNEPSYSAPSGCCRALGHPLQFGDLFLSAMVWMPFGISWLRSRRRRSRGN